MDHQGAIDHILTRLESSLPHKLRYHSYQHTLDVMHSAKVIAEAEGVGKEDLAILLTAAAYHDSGFLRSYERHEEVSCIIAEESLPDFGFDEDSIRLIHSLIMSTRVPQASDILLGRILCDADLDYLGCDGYAKIAEGLYEELLMNGFDINEFRWLDIQIQFLEEHQYWTEFSRENRTEKKAQVLEDLKSRRARLSSKEA